MQNVPFVFLWVNLQFNQGVIMARKIVLTSGKGGVGKTTVCANLGAMLAKFGFRVVIIDVDIGLNNLDVVMGLEDKVVYDIIDVANNKCRAKQALVQDKTYSSLYVLASAHSYASGRITKEQIKDIVDTLNISFDYILIDCPAGVEEGFMRAVYPAQEAIVVVTPHISSIRDADKVLTILSGLGIEQKYIVVNRMRGDMQIEGDMLDESEISEMLGVNLLGVIPEDDQISTSLAHGGLVGKSSSGRAFTLLCENLHEGTRKIYDCTNKYKGISGAIRRGLKKFV